MKTTIFSARALVMATFPMLIASLTAQTGSAQAPAAGPTKGGTSGQATASKSHVLFLGLPRMKTIAGSTEPRMDNRKFTVDPLLPVGAPGAKAAVKGDTKYLALEGGKEWSRPLRGSPREVTFVSFLAYGSEGTTLDIGGAKLQIKAGSKPSTAQVIAFNPKAPSASTAVLNYSVPLELHDNASMAALPVFTVRIDPVAGVWDLFAFDHLLFEDIPLANVTGTRKLTVQAGKEGAWICGLVTADENPLFIDANSNGIDDVFEKAKNEGKLLPANAKAEDRRKLAAAWQESQRATPSKSWPVKRLSPDGFAGTR